jgi:hypothetical protein
MPCSSRALKWPRQPERVDTNSITSPIVGFIFDQKGLMYNLTLEGSKISRIDR